MLFRGKKNKYVEPALNFTLMQLRKQSSFPCRKKSMMILILRCTHNKLHQKIDIMDIEAHKSDFILSFRRVLNAKMLKRRCFSFINIPSICGTFIFKTFEQNCKQSEKIRIHLIAFNFSKLYHAHSFKINEGDKSEEWGIWETNCCFLSLG